MFSYVVAIRINVEGSWISQWNQQLCLMQMHFNRQSAFLWEPTVFLLFIYWYEEHPMQWILGKNNKMQSCFFNFTFCYINDVIYIYQLIQYSKACFNQDFLYRVLVLARKVSKQGFLLVMLKSSHRTFQLSVYNPLHINIICI